MLFRGLALIYGFSHRGSSISMSRLGVVLLQVFCDSP